MKTIFCFLVISILFVGSSFAARMPVKVKFKDSKGAVIGTAKISEAKPGLRILVSVSSLAPGEHAIHFHENSDCTPPDFKKAGGHFNPGGKEHGRMNPKGAHAGDMDNFSVGADGKAAQSITNNSISFKKFREGGLSLVIHAKPDDNKSQPAGDAGDRVACAEIHER